MSEKSEPRKNMITLEDKKRIVARSFFMDNPDDYEDYREALVEMQNLPETFVSFAAESFLNQRKEGHLLLLTPEGHLFNLRTEDDFLEPVTEVTEDEGDKIHQDFEEMADQNPDINSAEILLHKLGWKTI